MDLERLKKQLKDDEGVRLVVYKDTRGFLTVGVGHRVTPADMLRVGQKISQARADRLFAFDLDRTIVDCARELEGWVGFPGDIQEILINLAFNLGIVGLLKFERTLSYLRSKAYHDAADALVASRWYRQVGNRSKRIVARLRALKRVSRLS